MKKLLVIQLLIAVMLNLTACKETTIKKTLVEGVWKSAYFLTTNTNVNGISIKSRTENYWIQFFEDSTCQLGHTQIVNNYAPDENEWKGTWSVTGDKISVTYALGTDTFTFKDGKLYKDGGGEAFIYHQSVG